jgi:Baseplate J-like protein
VSGRLPIDYVTKDYDGFLEMMKEKIPDLTPEWTDTSDSDQGMVILQLLAYGLHVLAYYEDKATNENILHLAQTKKAILLLSRFLGYEMTKQTPATSTVRFYKDDSRLESRVVIPKGTQVSTDPELGEQIMYETTEPVTIDPGEEFAEINVVQGETVNREFIGIGTGLDGQQFTLEYPDVIEEDIQIVTEENGKDYYWTLVDNFIDSQPTDRHFITTINEEDQTIVIFGDGIFGMKPPYDINVFSNYRHGGGTMGNVAVGLINTIVDTLVTGVDRVENTEPATGGEDYEDLEHVRIMAPKSFRTGGKAVTPTDFEDIAEGIYGVNRALCEETFNIDNEVILHIATTNMQPAPQTLLDKVKSELDKVRVMNSKLTVVPALYKDYNVEITVYAHENFVAQDVEEEVSGVVREYLETAGFGMGDTVFLGQIISRAFFASGVANVVVTNPTGDISCAYNEIPRLGEVSVTVIGGVQ